MRIEGYRGFEAVEQLVGLLRRVADEDHVAAGLECRVRALHYRTGNARALHRQVVAEDHALESEVFPQQGQPLPRKAGRMLVEFRIDHMRGHHRRQAHAEPAIGSRIVLQDVLRIALIDRDRDMRISGHKTVSRKVLATVGHAGLTQPVIDAFREQRNDTRIVVEGTVANDLGLTVVKVEHGRE